MPVLANYKQFEGRHYETGTIHNALAYQGVRGPHNGQPLSEALLLGISGGITVGYFLFEYEGYDPHIALLTRNTFDPMQTIFDRLGIPQEVIQTNSPEKGERNLIEALEGGRPALVWADSFTLPYNTLNPEERNWGMMPILVYGVEGDTVSIADRSGRPLHVTKATLAAARGRVKQEKYRLITLDAPDLSRLPSAVQKGIWQCVSLYTEAPPMGSRTNFGLAALEHWAKMLTNTRNKKSWARYFPPGRRMWAALAGYAPQPGAFSWIMTWGAAPGAERGLYADFLNEAAQLLGKPALNEAADQFRKSCTAWRDLANALLPEAVPLFAEARQLLLRRHAVFVEQGDAGIDEIRGINARLDALGEAAGTDFPLSAAEAVAMREDLSARVLRILELERKAVEMLQAALA